MANEWIYSSGSACYNTLISGYALSQNGILEAGKLYTVQFSISGMTQGKLILDCIQDKPEYTEDGDYVAIGIATSDNLTFIGGSLGVFVFDGCIDSVVARSIPYYRIEDLDGNTIFELSDSTGVSASSQYIQYQIDWTEIEENCYKIIIPDSGLEYESDCLNVLLTHDCTLLLSWTNDDNAFGFNYDDLSFTPKLRVKGKLWHPKYPKDKTIFKDSSGARSLLKSEISKERILTISEAPEYVHDAISIAVENDSFYVDGIKYTNEETEYTPKWRKSSQLAPAEIIIVKDQNLINDNC